jgi:hypothetical protein
MARAQKQISSRAASRRKRAAASKKLRAAILAVEKRVSNQSARVLRCFKLVFWILESVEMSVVVRTQSGQAPDARRSAMKSRVEIRSKVRDTKRTLVQP